MTELHTELAEQIQAIDGCRLALWVRLSRSFTFVGSTREQIVRAVGAGDLSQFDLDQLYQ